MRKIVIVDKRAQKELSRFPRPIQLKFRSLFEILEIDGILKKPFAKKLTNQGQLFEIRVKYQGEWRAIYAYWKHYHILILSAFAKKAQKTPEKELTKAKQRLSNYQGIL
ncbi:hypothetical protein A2W24_05135 [Microgenomates group bacterium RBG_16_45_19]|nr:MAG: hypothetical protein A2W24_05135 [Microgenomates group bacterium RBG_16_45_19]